MKSTRNTASLVVNVVDGTRKPLDAGVQLLLTVVDGNRKTLVREYFTKSSVEFRSLPVYGNFGDDYTVVAWAVGYKQAGFAPVRVKPRAVQELDLMLVPEKSSYSFADGNWDRIKAERPHWFDLLSAGADEQGAEERYSELMGDRPDSLACLLNILTAMDQIHLPGGTPAKYLLELIWDETMARDRFFAWASAELVNQVRVAAGQGVFAEEPAPGTFHSGATCSFKQVQFGEANVQLTFHENDRKMIAGQECVKVEPDIDYYRDLGAHAILEVAPNTLTGSLTDPKQVYALRWMAGRRSGLPEFAPPYTITAEEGAGILVSRAGEEGSGRVAAAG
jgi:hypothetical protein